MTANRTIAAEPNAVTSLPAPPGESPFHCKGLMYRELMESDDEQERRERRERIASIPKGPLQTFASQLFLATSWYDVLPLVALSEYGARRAGMSLEAYLRERARVAAERDLSSVFRVLLSVVSPNLVLNGLRRVVERLYDFGSGATDIDVPGHCVMRRLGVPEYFAEWYGLASAPYSKLILERAGARNVQVRFTVGPVNARRAGFALCDVTSEYHWR